MKGRLPSIVVALSLTASGLRGDDWPGAQVQNLFSKDGSHFVRIAPGTSWGDTVGFAGAGKGEYARGLFYALQEDRSYRLVADVALANPISPVDGLVTDRGELIAFDNWHNFGFGAAVAIYDPLGKLRASYTLEDLYGVEKAALVPQSVSSRWWRCDPMGFVDPESQTAVYVFEHFGGTFAFVLSPPSFSYSPGKAECRKPEGPFSATVLESR